MIKERYQQNDLSYSNKFILNYIYINYKKCNNNKKKNNESQRLFN